MTPIRNHTWTNSQRLLGMDRSITRRDFLNASLLGAGPILSSLPAPSRLLASNTDWDGYSGVGDYANSNGNTWKVMTAAHEARDGRYEQMSPSPRETGEVFDLVVVGGGLSGLGAAYYFSGSAQESDRPPGFAWFR
jgi:spermidine dehydrogenase